MIDVPPEPLSTQEQVIEQRLLDCGLNSGGFSVRYEDYLQSIEIVIASSAGATTDDFKCISEASGYEIVRFEDGAMFAAYMDFASELARPEMMVMFEDSLKEVGLWEGFPEREDFGSLKDYAEALEVHAGLEPGAALRVSGDGILFDPPNASADYEDFAERYSNLLSVVAYASTRDRLNFGFLGNERVEE
ncbi:hypothetical protein [Altericroceibacterium endophyticum]|uniref:Uncharacterized protein n=1 Tax=Altericroceibacterium endophyticum TaxID=1808508 RepID=A0A6I4T609_9SPHN|nr:hypothetical protein [Altericroceibacterium endophyticum]MXO66336.1 hypothetical protein [Altericroceibacterium endophyticum]